MHPVATNTVAFSLGLVLSTLVTAAVQRIGHKLYAPPIGPLTAAQVSSLPLGAFAFVEASYVSGSAVGGFATARAAASHAVQLTVALGLLLTVFGVQNLLLIPHPLWFAVVSTCSFLPAAYGGALLAGVHSGDPFF